MKRVVATLAGVVVWCVASSAVADIQMDAANIVGRMDAIQKNWAPLMNQPVPQHATMQRQAAFTMLQRKIGVMLKWSSAVRLEAERIRRGDIASERIELLRRYTHQWQLALNEVESALEELQRTQ